MPFGCPAYFFTRFPAQTFFSTPSTLLKRRDGAAQVFYPSKTPSSSFLLTTFFSSASGLPVPDRFAGKDPRREVCQQAPDPFHQERADKILCPASELHNFIPPNNHLSRSQEIPPRWSSKSCSLRPASRDSHLHYDCLHHDNTRRLFPFPRIYTSRRYPARR
jgi:hypothetical protein